MKVFSGSSNPKLASRLAAEMDIPLGKTELTRFANDEARVLVAEEHVDTTAVVVQSLSLPTDHSLIEFTLICDALRRMGVREITALIPWLGYSKQDKVFRHGEPLSVKVIAKIIQTVPLERVVTFDLHNLAILGFFDIPVTNLSARPLFEEYFAKKMTENTLVVAPDAGAVKASTAFAQELGVPVAYIDKKRDLGTGKVSIEGISRGVAGAEIIIVDDMIVTGSTLIEVANFLTEQGASAVRVGATHHLYVPGVQDELEQSSLTEIVVTDTVAPKEASGKLTVLSVAEIAAKAISRL